MSWQSPPIATARLTEVPETLVLLWSVIAANRAWDARRARRRRQTAQILLVVSPLASAATVGLWLLWTGWAPQ